MNTAVALKPPAEVVGTTSDTKKATTRDLAFVLFVSLAQPISASAYILFGGTMPANPMQQYRLWTGVMTEATSLIVLWYVLSRQARSWKDIGWSFRAKDIPVGLGLMVLASLTATAALLPFQLVYRAESGHFLQPKSIQPLFGFGISALSVTFICLNPFFEELIVRAYTMSEVLSLGGRQWLAVLVSVAVQVSYHLYQGLVNTAALIFVFAVLSIYFVRTRRIGPVIVAHLAYDMLFLLRGKF